MWPRPTGQGSPDHSRQLCCCSLVSQAQTIITCSNGADVPTWPKFQACLLFFFFLFYSYRLLLRNTRASSKKYSYGYLNFTYFSLIFLAGIHAIDQRNSKQVYIFLLKVLNRKKKLFFFWMFTYNRRNQSLFLKLLLPLPYAFIFWIFCKHSENMYIFYDLELLRHNFFYSVSIHTWIFHWHWMDFEHQIGFIIKYGVN